MAGCIWLKKDGCKGLGGQAVGYWGRDIYKTINAEQLTGKELANLRELIEAGGLRAALWLGVQEGNQSSCYKETHRSADRKCKSCHGVVGGLVPGYRKWGYNTLWMAPTDDDITLTNLEVTTQFKSAKVILVGDNLTGTIESGDKPFTRSAFGSYWESDVAAYVRIDAYSSITTEYSLNSGSTWSDISQLAIVNPASGTIRYRATIQRDSAQVLSPLFEIVRARFAEVPLSHQRIDGSYFDGPWIKVMKSTPKASIVKGESGDVPSVAGLSFWTVGLSAFDSRIEVGSDGEKLEGPNVVIELLDGTFKNDKFILIDWSLSDPRGFVTMTQTFNARAEDGVGPLSLVW